MNSESLEIPILEISKDFQVTTKFFDSVAIIFVYLLHQNHLPPNQQNTFLNAIEKKDLPMVNMTKKFAYHLLHNMNKDEKLRLSTLQKDKSQVANLRNEALVDFIEIDMVDPTVTFRQWEYGKYAIKYFLNQLDYKNTSKVQNSKGTTDNDLIERFTSQLVLNHKSLDNHEKLFLVQALKAKLKLDGPNMASYDLIGNIVQSNLLGMSLRIDVLKSAYLKSLSLAIENRNKKGPKL